MVTRAGPKISQNVNYTQRGTMEGPKAPSEARKREALEYRGVGFADGVRRSPSPVCGSGGPDYGLGALPPENFEI